MAKKNCAAQTQQQGHRLGRRFNRITLKRTRFNCRNLKRIGLRVTSVLFLCSIFWLGTCGVAPPPKAWADTAALTGAERVGTELAGTELATGEVLFETNCAGCHPNGGNIIKRGKTLKLKPLTRRHLDSVDAIATFVTNGKGLMSAYGDILTPDEINAVSIYVWEQAQSNWTP